MHRRSFLTGLAAALAAPAIVRPGILMPIKSFEMPIPVIWGKGARFIVGVDPAGPGRDRTGIVFLRPGSLVPDAFIQELWNHHVPFPAPGLKITPRLGGDDDRKR